MKYLDRFHPSNHYHIFNHAVGNENLFRSAQNCDFFLAKFEQKLSPVFDTLSFCLMPNHFHFLVKVKAKTAILELAKIENEEGFDYHRFAMQRLSNFLNGYAKSYNNMFLRKGALFIDYTKRIELKDLESILAVMKYIHLNPIKHGFCDAITDWPYSSYQDFLYENWHSVVDRKLIGQYFKSREEFIDFHIGH